MLEVHCAIRWRLGWVWRATWLCWNDIFLAIVCMILDESVWDEMECGGSATAREARCSDESQIRALYEPKIEMYMMLRHVSRRF